MIYNDKLLSGKCLSCDRDVLLDIGGHQVQQLEKVFVDWEGFDDLSVKPTEKCDVSNDHSESLS